MPKKESKTAPILLMSDYWDADCVRIKAGTVIDLPIDEAKTMIANHVAVRADPLPGDETNAAD